MTIINRRGWLAGAAAAAAAPRIAAAREDAFEELAPLVVDELRGLSLSAGGVWASGSHGTVIVESQVRRPPGVGALDFRGLHAFSGLSALVMSAGPGEASQLWRSDDAGLTWARVAINTDPEGFWDAIVFVDARRGFILGDPTDGRFTLLSTGNGGASWKRTSARALPPLVKDEAAFAASNGSLAIGPRGRVAFCTGGGPQWARAYLSRNGGRSFTALEAPIPAGASTRGGFACAFDETGALWMCGGDYQAAKGPGVNLARLAPEAKAFEAIAAPAGYLSSVAARKGVVVATGLAGTIVSGNGGPFRRVSEAPFNTVRLSPSGMAALVGPKGARGRLR